MTVIAPPFTLESATQKVRLAEDGWNTRDPEKVSLAYTPDSRWRNRSNSSTDGPTSRNSSPADLQKSSVRVELCGATAKAHHWGNVDLLPGIKVNADAMARTIQLVQEGFVKITE
jgi:hypothetical protein